MAHDPVARRRPDSYQIIGLLVIGGVLAGLVGFALERFDVVILLGAGIVVALGFVGARDRTFGSDGVDGGGHYEPGDGCGDGGGD